MAIQKRKSVHPKSSSDQECWEDEVLREVYAVRDEYAAEHGHDLNKIYEDLKRREANSALIRSKSQPLVQG
jgi:hypothetical protein